MDTTVKAAYLFPGQGAQAVGMGRDLYDGSATARAVFEEADAALGYPLSELIFNGPAESLQRTEFTQPAILTVSIAAFRVLAEGLAESGIVPAYAAGHSLGEYAAHVIAGSMSFAEAVRTVRLRGQFMQQAVPEGVGAMAAILGLPEPQINDLCAQVADELGMALPSDLSRNEAEQRRSEIAQSVVSPANLNSPEQTVISGSQQAVERVVELSKAAGAKKTIMLKVSAPFHCALMQPAQEELAKTLESLQFQDPAFPVVCNVDARLVTRRADIRDCLIRQVTGPVRWVECVELLVAQGVTHLVEVGPGRVLTGLTRQILGRGVEWPVSLNVEDQASLAKTVAVLTAASQAMERTEPA